MKREEATTTTFFPSLLLLLVGWLVGRLAGWLAGRLGSFFLVGWLIGWLVAWLGGWVGFPPFSFFLLCFFRVFRPSFLYHPPPPLLSRLNLSFFLTVLLSSFFLWQVRPFCGQGSEYGKYVVTVYDRPHTERCSALSPLTHRWPRSRHKLVAVTGSTSHPGCKAIDLHLSPRLNKLPGT